MLDIEWKLKCIRKCSIALVVDSVELLNRLGKAFLSKAEPRFIILLWGEKASLDSDLTDEFLVYQYDDIMGTGQENRKRSLDSADLRKYKFHHMHQTFFCSSGNMQAVRI